MRSRPRIVLFEHAGGCYAAIHGGAEVINRFLWPSLPDAAFAAEIAVLKDRHGPLDRVIAGHTGIAFERQVEGTRWINAGAFILSRQP